ncbi:MAG: flippase-like domain-containing protein [Deltaproteobacteria bacterium]|jgi:uncharacterized protein (TIRG00374 family)|nr:flippase-like domain-containing protein [Deltaproteobacteria bacterium]MBW2537430.1 flippase-like domain-containing protein [Deltaproteobacteria bacterium]
MAPAANKEARDGNVERPPAPGLSRWLLTAIGPVILLVILASIDVGELGRLLSGASAGYWVLGYLAAIPAILLRVIRLQLVLGPEVGRPRFVDVLHVYCYANFVGSVTPGRLGEFIKLLHLTRWGASSGSALATVLLERIPDVMFFLIVGAIALGLLAFPEMGGTTEVVLIAAAPLAGIGLFWFLLFGPGTRGALRVLAVVTRRRFAEKVAAMRAGFVEAVAGIGRSTVAIVLVLTVLAWAVNYLSNYLFAVSLDLKISYLELAGISAICSLIAFLPISILGAGTRDAALIVMLAHYDASEAEAVALSTLLLSFLAFNALLCSYSLATPAARIVRQAKPRKAPDDVDPRSGVVR